MKIEQIAYKRGYRITELGLILNPKLNSVKGVLCNRGYMAFGIRCGEEKTTKRCFIHRLQAYQKYGNKIYERGIQVRHKNNNKTDNSWENILIGTQSENMMDIPEQIRIAKAVYASSFNKKHNQKEVFEWYVLNGKSYKKTMEKFNISSKGTLHWILQRYCKLNNLTLKRNERTKETWRKAESR